MSENTPANHGVVCRYFATTGSCLYADQCNFVHAYTPQSQAPSFLGTEPDRSAPKSQRTCRNITLYGSCKYEGKGCEFNHDVPASNTPLYYEPSQNYYGGYEEDYDYQQGNFYSNHQQVIEQQAQLQIQNIDNVQRHLQFSPYEFPHTQPEVVGRKSLQSFFMPDKIRIHYKKQLEETLKVLDNSDPILATLPQMANKFSHIYPLDNTSRSDIFGYPTTLYKCISNEDGLPFAVRRINGLRLTKDSVPVAAQVWAEINHPNIVNLRDFFVSKEGNDTGVFFVYDYHPCSETLEQKYFLNNNNNNNNSISENSIWSIICQLVSAIQRIHSVGLSCKLLDPSRILVTGNNRIRINGVGILDVTQFENNNLPSQQEDLISLGKIALMLSCESLNVLQNPNSSLEYVANNYSQDLKNFIVYLLSKPSGVQYLTINEVCQMIAGRMLLEVEHLQNYNDSMESEFRKEVENGRLLRILIKLGFINERPEFEGDIMWSETGDKYMLKLFRDYVFHQIYEDSSPCIDFGHVVDTLNKVKIIDTESRKKLSLK